MLLLLNNTCVPLNVFKHSAEQLKDRRGVDCMWHVCQVATQIGVLHQGPAHTGRRISNPAILAGREIMKDASGTLLLRGIRIDSTRERDKAGLLCTASAKMRVRLLRAPANPKRQDALVSTSCHRMHAYKQECCNRQSPVASQ
eukprot:364558-Chlamydomonas_euryale.AAC.7